MKDWERNGGGRKSRADNAKEAAAARRQWVKDEAKKLAKAFEKHPGSTPAGHKGKK